LKAFFRFLFLPVFIAVLVSVSASARVFMKVPSEPRLLMDAAGGRRVYDSAFKINGTDSRVSAYVFEESSDAVGAQLLPKIGVEGRREAENTVIRLPKNYGHSTVVLLDGEKEDASTALLVESNSDPSASEPDWGFRDISMPQGFTPSFSAVDSEAATRVCIGKSVFQDGIAMQIILEQMIKEGWTCATPGAERISSAFFTRGGAIAVVSVLPRDTGSGMLIMRKAGRQLK
jgi:hypothetical protein